MGIYLDYAATTYIDERVLEAMKPYFSKDFGNPGSFHDMGLKAKEAVENARVIVAEALNAKPEEIIFTGSGTESINLAIKGVARAMKEKGKHIITSKIEHHAVIDSCEYLKKEEGFEVTYLDVGRDGIVNLEQLKGAIKKETILITIMYANNEIGTIQPIEEIGRIAKANGIYFHTDACQATEYLEMNVEKLNADLMSINGSKIYGPKGTGALYVRKGVKIKPIIHGGGQEFGLRSGTENVPGIVGFGKAVEIAAAEKKSENERLTELREMLIKGLVERIPKTILNGHPTKRLPNNVNVSILDVEGEAVLLHLNQKGIYASTGSACTSQSLEPSHVIMALGMPYEVSHGSLRFSLGKKTTKEHIKKVLKVLPPIVKKLRELSPVKLEVEEVMSNK